MSVAITVCRAGERKWMGIDPGWPVVNCVFLGQAQGGMVQMPISKKDTHRAVFSAASAMTSKLLTAGMQAHIILTFYPFFPTKISCVILPCNRTKQATHGLNPNDTLNITSTNAHHTVIKGTFLWNWHPCAECLWSYIADFDNNKICHASLRYCSLFVFPWVLPCYTMSHII